MMNSRSIEKPLFEARLASWRGNRGGIVAVFPDSIEVWTKRTWFRRPSLETQFGTSTVDSFKIEGTLQEILVLSTSAGDQGFSFANPADARGLCNVLRAQLGPLDEVSKTEMRRNEEERLERERERERTAKIQAYPVWFWSVTNDYVALARGAYRIVSLLRVQDWKEAKSEYSAMWQRAESLEHAIGVVLISNLEELGKACSELDGPAAVRKCSSFLAALAATSTEIAPHKSPLKEDEMRELIHPNWYHLRFFLLFSCLNREVTLAAEMGDWASVEASLSKMGTLTGVLSSVFLAPVGEQVDGLSDATKRRDNEALQKRSGTLDDFLVSSMNAVSYREVH